MDFIIDTVGEENVGEKCIIFEHEPEECVKDAEVSSFTNQKLAGFSDLKSTAKKSSKSKTDDYIDDFFSDMGWCDNKSEPNKKCIQKGFQYPNFNVESGRLDCNGIDEVDIKEEMKNSAITPGFEKLHNIPMYDPSEKKLKSDRRNERAKTKGGKWFNLPATEVTEEVKRDLEVLQMRSVLDPKHFYKKNDLAVLPKYFQVGKVMDAPLDYYNSRMTNKQRKRTMVDELLQDAEFSKYNKKRYKEIIEQRRKTHYKAHQKAKKLKRRKK